ncbi:conserved hypothetical protein, partial [Ixodes scapularis]
DRPKKKAPLSTLRKRLARRRWRASKCFDHAQVFHDFLNSTGWTVREVAALVHEYEATAALRELVVQADAARPLARSCRADLGRLLEGGLCADVTLAYRGTEFPAHRALLSARCPFFRDLLCEGGPRQQMVRPSSPPPPPLLSMDIPGVGVDLFRDLLRYLYTGELSVAGDGGALSTLLRLSEQFGVPNPLAHDLRRLLEGRAKHRGPTNALSLRNFRNIPKKRQHLWIIGTVRIAGGHLADASLVWEVPGSEQEAQFPCHRAVLAARSPFFRGVVQRRCGAEAPGGRLRVVLDGGVVPLRHARVLLWSLYQDAVELSSLACGPSGACGGGSFPEELMELYEVARLLELDSLAQGEEETPGSQTFKENKMYRRPFWEKGPLGKACCEDALVELLSPETLCGVLQWSEQPHGSPWVHRQALGFLAEEFSALAQTPLLLQLTKGQLATLLRSDFLQARPPCTLSSINLNPLWGEHQLLKRVEEREPNVVSQTAHSVARRGARGRRELLSDGELRELLSELLCQVRTAHVLPLSAEALLSAQRRGLLPRPPPCMLGGEEPPPRGGASAGWLGTGRGPHARPRLFAPYVEEAKGAPHSQGGGASAVYSPWQHLSNIPDTLYMVDKAPGFRESCPSLPSLTASGTHRGPDPTLPVLGEEVLRQMRQREQELRQGAGRALSLVSGRGEVGRQLQLRVVREMGLPDQAAALLACAPEERPPSRESAPQEARAPAA